MAKVTYINPSNIIGFTENPRQTTEFRDLATIAERGLDKPLVVRHDPVTDGMYEIGQGHRRFGYIQNMARTNPEAYAVHFPKGIPCEILPKDTTFEQFALIVADHGESRTLTTDWEHYLLVRLLTKAGLTRKGIILKTASLFNAVKPFKNAELTAKVNELTRQAENPDASLKEQVKAEMELEEVTIKARTGLIQRYQSVFAMPEIVEACYQFVCTGEKRDGYDDVEFPSKLTEAQIKKLYSKKNGYLKDVENNQAEECPLFWERWNEYLEESKATKDEGPRKSRSRKEVVETRDGMDSGMAKTILGYACNESGVGEEKVRALDEELCMLEWLKATKPKEFKAYLAEYRTWSITKDEALSEEE